MNGFLPFWCSLWFPCFDLPPPLLIWASFWFRLQILWNPVASYGNRFLAPCFPRLRKFFLFRPALHVLETGLCVFFKTFPTICGARVFPPSDEWNVVDVSIQFLVTGHTLSLFTISLFILPFTLWVIIYSHECRPQCPVMNYIIKSWTWSCVESTFCALRCNFTIYYCHMFVENDNHLVFIVAFLFMLSPIDIGVIIIQKLGHCWMSHRCLVTFTAAS
jgi:hypothetical protein